MSGLCCRSLVSVDAVISLGKLEEVRRPAKPACTYVNASATTALVSRSDHADTAIDQIACDCRISSAACSPITTQVAIVFPVVMRGMIEASAMRRQSMP